MKKSSSRCRILLTLRNTSAPRMRLRMPGWISRTVSRPIVKVKNFKALIYPAVPDQMVSMEDFPKLQKPEDSLKVTNPNTGETGYRVGLEVFHQLHCLNLLRMSTYPDYYPKVWWSDMNDKAETVRAHLGTFCRRRSFRFIGTAPNNEYRPLH